uniref:ribonuclease P protein subunit p14-like n=1 Tax=Styela clava TaxID=7725 RepID=UPI001939B8BA|nr:ribonuclease P protein subunit p14-like [Styela clava]XP_039262373.1 ribonuclease P protein subunit p14-like [Styela clava]
MQSAISFSIFQDIQRQKHDTYIIHFKIICQPADIKLDEKQAEIEIYKSMSTLHGQAGVAFSREMVEYNETEMTGSIEISTKAVSRLWSALTLKSSVEGGRCAIRVINIVPHV